MKKAYGLLAGLLIAVVFPTVVSAESSFDMTCEPLEVARNGEANCTLKITSTDGEPIQALSAVITIENEPQMSYANIISVNNGWTDVSNGKNLKFNSDGTIAVLSPSDVATFRVKVAADATECGKVCVTNLVYDGKTGISTPVCQTISLANQGTTIPDTPIIDNPIIDNSTTEDNPQTGSFVPYVVISGAALLAIGAIVVASKKSKFYNI